MTRSMSRGLFGGTAVALLATFASTQWGCGGGGKPGPATSSSPPPAASPLPSDGSFIVLHDFGPGVTAPANPSAGLVFDSAGNLYGTTRSGGMGPCTVGFVIGGCGVVFKLAPGGAFTVLHSFNQSDGSGPGDLVFDSAENLYGTTASGGAQNHGVVFRLGSDTTYEVLHDFAGVSEGAIPQGGLVLGRGGDLYGTTSSGGGNGGVIFELTPSSTYSVLHRFNGADGEVPVGSLVLDSKGNLYGTTEIGGATSEAPGGGTVFKLASDGTFAVLHDFPFRDGKDGTGPRAGLVLDNAGNLYGTTVEGGAGPCPLSGAPSVVLGCGVVFKIAPDGAYAVLHTFVQSEGAMSLAGLVLDSAGNLYGTTQSGGSSTAFNSCVHYGGFTTGDGVVFKLAPDGTLTVLHSFNESDGEAPQAGLVLDRWGNLYGTTHCGGAIGEGVVFRVAPNDG